MPRRRRISRGSFRLDQSCCTIAEELPGRTIPLWTTPWTRTVHEINIQVVGFHRSFLAPAGQVRNKRERQTNMANTVETSGAVVLAGKFVGMIIRLPDPILLIHT